MRSGCSRSALSRSCRDRRIRGERAGRHRRKGARPGGSGAADLLDRDTPARRRAPQHPLPRAGAVAEYVDSGASTDEAPDRRSARGTGRLDKKAEQVVALDLRSLSSFTDHFLLATATNQKQLVAIADGVEEILRDHGLRPGIGGVPAPRVDPVGLRLVRGAPLHAQEPKLLCSSGSGRGAAPGAGGMTTPVGNASPAS